MLIEKGDRHNLPSVFVLKDRSAPMVFLATPDCRGVEITGNALFGGNGRFAGGAATAAVIEGNTADPLGKAPRPKPQVPSIYEWQQKNRR